MHTFRIKVLMLGSCKPETAEEVRQLVKETLHFESKINRKILKDTIDKALGSILGYSLLCTWYMWVDTATFRDTPETEAEKSFWINIMLKDKSHILIAAEYRELKTLRDIAAAKAAKLLKHEEDVEKLVKDEFIPKSLSNDIKQHM